MYSGALAFLPLWALFLVTAAISLSAVWLGYQIGIYRSRRSEAGDHSVISSMVAATLALLAFILAMSYGTAANNFETRRQLVVTEASTIGSTYSIAGLLPEPHSSQIRSILREYVTVRANGWQLENLQQTFSRSEGLQDQIWSEVMAVQKDNPDSVVTVLFVQSLTQLTGVHDLREAEAAHHILATVWFILYFVSFMGMAALGYQSGLTGKLHWLVISALVLAFAAALWLLADFDRPLSGTLSISQQPMLDLLEKLVAP